MNEHHATCHHKTYYLTCEDYDALWEFSGGRCQAAKLEMSRRYLARHKALEGASDDAH